MLGTRLGFTAFTIAMGSSYFQVSTRLLFIECDGFPLLGQCPLFVGGIESWIFPALLLGETCLICF